MKGKAGWALLLVLALAAGLRVWAVYDYSHAHPLSDAPTIDESSYDEWASELAAGERRGEEVFFQEPLYPYFLGGLYAVFGRDLLLVRLIQAALGVLSCWLVAKLGERLAGEWAGVLASLLVACAPSLVLLPCLLLKPNLHLPLFCASALLITRPGTGGIRRWFAIGLVGALCALLRGNSLVLLGAFFVWSILPSPRGLPSFIRCVSFSLGVALFLVPVAWRNHEVGGVWAITTSGAGTNLYGGNNLKNPMGVATELPFVRGIPEHEAADWRREAERQLRLEGEDEPTLDPGEVSRYWLMKTARSLVHEPLAHLGIFWNKLRATLGWYAVPDNHSLAWDAGYVGALRLPAPGFGVLAALGLAGCLAGLFQSRQRDSEREAALLRSALLLGLYLVTIVLTVTSMRARMPLMILLAPFAGAWILSLARRPRLTPLLIVIVTSTFVAWPVFSAEERAQDLSERDYNLAVHQLESGRPTPETRDLVVRLVAAHPNTSRIRILSAQFQFAESLRLREADKESTAVVVEDAALAVLAEITESGSVSPRERRSAHHLAGRIYKVREDWERADLSLRAAREFTPRDAGLALEHLSVLVAGAEAEQADELRARYVEEADRLLEELEREDVSFPERAGLRERLTALRG